MKIVLIALIVLLVAACDGPDNTDTIEGKRVIGADYELLISGGPGSHYWTWRVYPKCVYDLAQVGDGLKPLIDQCR